MKSKGFRDFRKELSEAGRFGSTAVRVTMDAALEAWGSDPERLSELAAMCEKEAFECRDDELTGTWLFLYDQVWNYARIHLKQEDYHRFCVSL